MRVLILCAALVFTSDTFASENDGSGSDKALKPIPMMQWESAFYGFLCRYFGMKCAFKGETQGTNKSENDGSGSGD